MDHLVHHPRLERSFRDGMVRDLGLEWGAADTDVPWVRLNPASALRAPCFPGVMPMDEHPIDQANDDGFIDLATTAGFFPSARRPGRGISTSALSRYRSEGLIGRDGKRHRLQTWRIGGATVTTRRAVREFLEAINRPAISAKSIRTPAARRQADRAAASKLARFGCIPRQDG